MSKNKYKKREKLRCIMCGRAIPPSEVKNYVVGATGHRICYSCLAVSKQLRAVEPYMKPIRLQEPTLTPQNIISGLDKSIIGQPKAKRAIAVAMWKQVQRAKHGIAIPRVNLLLYGPTGSGKSALVQKASELVDLPFLAFDATTITENGYKGRDAHEIIDELISRHKGNPHLENAVVFLDEFDKLSARGSSDRQVNSRAAQHALLKLLEGYTISHDNVTVSTKGMLFILAGAFTGLSAGPVKKTPLIGFDREDADAQESTDACEVDTEAFIDYGIEPEIMGRIGQLVEVEKLSEQDLVRILLESDLSAYLEYVRFFSQSGVTLQLDHNGAAEIARKALERGTGARGLNALVEKLVEPYIMQLADGSLSGSVSLVGGDVV